MTRRLAHSHRRQGTTIVLVLLLLPVMLGFAALTIDLGYLNNVRAQSQNAVDAAALAAVSAFTNTSETPEMRSELAIQRVHEYLDANLSSNLSASANAVVEVGRWVKDTRTFVGAEEGDLRRVNALRVVITLDDVPSFFAGIFGIHSFAVTRESIAAIGQRGCKLWARKKAEIKSGSKTDSFDALAGAYDALSAGSEGDVCSCGDIKVGNSSLIDGNAFYGEGGQIVGSLSNITGETGVLPDCPDPTIACGGGFVDNLSMGSTDSGGDPFADMFDSDDSDGPFPDSDDSDDSNDSDGPMADDDGDDSDDDAANDGDDILPALPCSFTGFSPDDLDLHIDDTTLTLPPGTFYFKKLKMRKNAILQLTGPTTLYVEDQFDVHDSAIVNPSQDPMDLRIIVAGKKVHFKNAADVYAYIVAPDAKVKFDKGGDLFGAVIGKAVTFKQGSDFHADQSISLFEIPGPLALVR